MIFSPTLARRPSPSHQGHESSDVQALRKPFVWFLIPHSLALAFLSSWLYFQGVNITLLPSINPPDYQGYAQAAIEEGVRIFETAGNNPGTLIRYLKGHGTFRPSLILPLVERSKADTKPPLPFFFARWIIPSKVLG
jgi:hypothetical protein